MTAAVAWLLGIAGLLILPSDSRPRAVEPAAGSRASGRPARGRSSGRAAGPIGLAVVAAAAGSIAALGPRTGLVVAVVLGPAVAVGVRRLQRRPARSVADDALPLVLDLTGAALRAGRPLADALGLAAPAGGDDTADALLRVAGLCRLGADPAQAWSAVPRDGPLGDVAAVAVRSATSGIKLAAAFERLAADLRTQRRAAAAARAHRAGISAMAPLAACFLPSFVCLGVIPVVVGVAKSTLGVLP